MYKPKLTGKLQCPRHKGYNPAKFPSAIEARDAIVGGCGVCNLIFSVFVEVNKLQCVIDERSRLIKNRIKGVLFI